MHLRGRPDCTPSRLAWHADVSLCDTASVWPFQGWPSGHVSTAASEQAVQFHFDAVSKSAFGAFSHSCSAQTVNLVGSWDQRRRCPRPRYHSHECCTASRAIGELARHCGLSVLLSWCALCLKNLSTHHLLCSRPPSERWLRMGPGGCQGGGIWTEAPGGKRARDRYFSAP
eukprot:131928-Rhodomonas_salina.1